MGWMGLPSLWADVALVALTGTLFINCMLRFAGRNPSLTGPISAGTGDRAGTKVRLSSLPATKPSGWDYFPCCWALSY
jgi:hypothetical protein